MYIITATYPNGEGATFDYDHYRGTHLPKLGEALRNFGLGYVSVLKGETALDGSPAPYLVQTTLSFSTEQGARDAAASEEAAAILADTPNFTNVTPVLQFNTAVP